MKVVPNPIPSPAPVQHGMQVDDHCDGQVSTQVLAGDCNEVIMQTLDLLTMLYSNLQWQLLSRSLSPSLPPSFPPFSLFVCVCARAHACLRACVHACVCNALLL